MYVSVHLREWEGGGMGRMGGKIEVEDRGEIGE